MRLPSPQNPATESSDDDFTPQEAQRRFEATLRAALNTPPQHRKSVAGKPVKGKKVPSRASGASAKTGRPRAGNRA
jgi:hypothetical protein